MTALVGAMIVNESQAGSFGTEPVPPSELPPKDGLQVAIGDRQTRPSQFFLAGDDSDDRTVEMGTKQPYVSDELDRSGSEAFYAVDENLETPVAEFLEQLFAQEAFVPDTHESNIYEVTQTDLSNYLSMEWSGQDPATEATADTQGEQEEDSRTSLTEADFEDLALEEGELDPNQITIAESSEGTYLPVGSLAQAGGGGGGGDGRAGWRAGMGWGAPPPPSEPPLAANEPLAHAESPDTPCPPYTHTHTPPPPPLGWRTRPTEPQAHARAHTHTMM